jgi:hypothetical protein
MIPQVDRPTPAPIPLTLPKLLLAEGNTPMHLLEALLRSLGISESVEIRNFGGIGQLKTHLPALQLMGGFADVISLGIVRDAEGDAAAARQSVEQILASAGLTDKDRAAFNSSVFNLPDNAHAGMIEDLCLAAVQDDPVYGCVERFMECAESVGADLPQGLARSKSLAQVYLATKDDPQMFPGLAAYKGHWPFASPVFDELKAFLRSL